MLNTSFLACTKVRVMGAEGLYCGEWRKISKCHSDLDNAHYQTCPRYFHILQCIPILTNTL